MEKNKLRSILERVKTIAVVGASSNPSRDSFKVTKFLIEKGYEVYPINPNETNNNILGRKFLSNLNEIGKKINLVDIFRAKKFVMDITKDSIEIGVDVIWTQEGIKDKKSAYIAKKAGIIFVMDECPKKVLEN